MEMIKEKKKIVKDYKDLDVHRRAMAVAMRIFEESKAFPEDEKYSLRSQIRNSSRSVCANIAEAWRKRRYRAAFISKLNDAETEASETQVWVEFAYRCGYWPYSLLLELNEECNHILAQLMTMMSDADKWSLG